MYEIIRIAPTRHQNPRTMKIRNSMDIFLRCSLPFWYPMLHTTQYPSRDRRRLSNLELVDNAANARKTLYLIRMKVHDLERSNAQSSYNGFSPRPKYWNCKQLSWYFPRREIVEIAWFYEFRISSRELWYPQKSLILCLIHVVNKNASQISIFHVVTSLPVFVMHVCYKEET